MDMRRYEALFSAMSVGAFRQTYMATLDIFVIIDIFLAQVRQFLQRQKGEVNICMSKRCVAKEVVLHGRFQLTFTNLRAWPGWTRSSRVDVVTRIGG